MGQDQAKPAGAGGGNSGGISSTVSNTSSGGAGGGGFGGGAGFTVAKGSAAEYEAERAKMVHVAKAEDLDHGLPQHLIESNRLLFELNQLQPVHPLIRCTEERSFMNQQEKVEEEVLHKSAILSQYRLPHDKTVKALATWQTASMREAIQATARTDDISNKMQHTAYLISQLKTSAWTQTHEVAVLNQSLVEGDRLADDVNDLMKEAEEVCDLLADVQALLSDEQKSDIQKAVLEEEAAALRESQKHYGSKDDLLSNPSFSSPAASAPPSGAGSPAKQDGGGSSSSAAGKDDTGSSPPTAILGGNSTGPSST